MHLPIFPAEALVSHHCRLTKEELNFLAAYADTKGEICSTGCPFFNHGHCPIFQKLFREALTATTLECLIEGDLSLMTIFEDLRIKLIRFGPLKLQFALMAFASDQRTSPLTGEELLKKICGEFPPTDGLAADTESLAKSLGQDITEFNSILGP